MPLPFPLLFAMLAWRWVLRLGGLGLVLIGVLDNSIVPLTGSMDVLTIWLAAGHHSSWPYYAVMATVGAVLGGYITYAIGRKGGKEAIERKLKKDKADKLLKRFDKWGFGSVTVGALLPPPFPLVPVLLAAGALQYSTKKFLAALTLGRSVRYFLVAGLGSLYAKQITSFFNRYYKTTALVLAGLAAIGSFFAIREYLHSRKSENERQPVVRPRHAA
jgi:membrane protein YqaA with SNARE-associated domain